MEKKRFKDMYNLEERKNLFLNWSNKFEKKIFVIAEASSKSKLPFFSEV